MNDPYDNARTDKEAIARYGETLTHALTIRHPFAYATATGWKPHDPHERAAGVVVHPGRPLTARRGASGADRRRVGSGAVAQGEGDATMSTRSSRLTPRHCVRCVAAVGARKAYPWTCRACGRRCCEHFCSLKQNDGTALCERCRR